MTALSFEVHDVRAEPYAVQPTIVFAVRVSEADGLSVHALALRCPIRIEPQRRRYGPAEEQALRELFGDPAQWSDSLRPFVWTHVSTVVGMFTGSVVVDLPVECTYDLQVSASKLLHHLHDGVLPVVLCFSGTSFTVGERGMLATPVSWDADARFEFPVAVWHRAMDLSFPNSAWMRVGHDTLDAVGRFKARRALPTWDLALEQLLKEAGEPW